MVRFTSLQIKPALKGEVDASATSRRRGCIEAALVYANPSVGLRRQLPGRGAFWCSTNYTIKQTRERTASPHLHKLPRSPAARRISHGGAIFHCASAQFHPAPAGFHRGRKPATSPRRSGRISALLRPMLPRGPLFGQGHRARCVCPPRQDRCPLRRPRFQGRPSPPQGRVCGGSW